MSRNNNGAEGFGPPPTRLFPFLDRARRRAAGRAAAEEEAVPEWQAPFVPPVDLDDEDDGGAPIDREEDGRDDDEDDGPAQRTVDEDEDADDEAPVARRARTPRRSAPAPTKEDEPETPQEPEATAPRKPARVAATPRARAARTPAPPRAEASAPAPSEAPAPAPEAPLAQAADDPPAPPVETATDATVEGDAAPFAWPPVPLAPLLDDPTLPCSRPDHPLRRVDPARARIRLCIRHPSETFEMDADLYPLDTTIDAIAAAWGGLWPGDWYIAAVVEVDGDGAFRQELFATVFTSQDAPASRFPIRPWRVRPAPGAELPASLVERLRCRALFDGEFVEGKPADPGTAKGRLCILEGLDEARPVTAEVERLARLHGVSPSAIQRWRRDYAAGGVEALAPRRRGRPPAPAPAPAPVVDADGPEALLAQAGRYIARMTRAGYGPGAPEADLAHLERLLALAPRFGGLGPLLAAVEGTAAPGPKAGRRG